MSGIASSKDEERGRRREETLFRLTAVSVLFTANVFVFGPFDLFSINVDEFSFSLFEFYLFSIPLLTASTLALIGLGWFLSRWRVMGECYVAIVFCVSVLTWIDGNLLAKDFVMEDQGFDFDLWSIKGAFDVSLWLLAPLMAIFFHERLNRHVAFFAVAMFMVQGFGMIGLGVSRPGIWRAKPTRAEGAEVLRKIRGFSRRRNVIHIVVDEMQSDLLAEAVRSNSALYGKKLSGFTFFENCLANYEKTRMSVPSFLTSIPFVNEEPLDDYLERSYNEENVILLLSRHGYSADVVTVPPVMFDSAKYNVYAPRADFELERLLANQEKWFLLDCVIHKRFPEFIKAIMCANPDAFPHRFLYPNAHFLTLNYFSCKRFVESLAERATVDREEPVYKFFHLMGAHDPCVLNEKGEYDPSAPLSDSRKRAVQQAYFFDVIVSFLDKLRALGIYDSSLIVIHSDHGGYVPVAKGEGRNLRFPPNHPMGEALTGRVLATLLVKPPRAKGELAWSQAPVELMDVPATIAGCLGVSADFFGGDAFAEESGGPRHYYCLSKEINEKIYDRITEFSINGDVLDVDHWRLKATHRCSNLKKDAPSYALGTIVDMRKGGSFKRFYSRGWGSDDKGSWVMGRRAAIQLSLAESATDDLVVRFDVAFHPDSTGGGKSARLSAYVNGEFAWGKSFHDKTEASEAFSIPFELVEKTDNILITFMAGETGGEASRRLLIKRFLVTAKGAN